MKFLHTMVRVSNVDDSLQFYCEGLGLQQVRRIDNDQGRFSLIFLASVDDIEVAKLTGNETGFVTGLPMLELTYNWPPEGNSGDDEIYTGGRNFGHLAYQTQDIYELCQRLMDMGYTINRPPRDGYMAFVRSPDDISIELLQAGEHLDPQSPWKEMENIGEW